MNFSVQISSVHLEVAVLGLRETEADLVGDEFEEREYDDVVVEHHSNQQDAEANQLKIVECLPANEHAHGPDDERPHAVQHHPGRGRQLLRHGDAGKVKEGNGGHRT